MNTTHQQRGSGSAPRRQRSAPKRSPPSAACNACRLRKVACDGTRPACSRCVKCGRSCTYVTASPGETRVEALKRQVAELTTRERHASDVLAQINDLPATILDVPAAPDPSTALLLQAQRRMYPVQLNLDELTLRYCESSIVVPATIRTDACRPGPSIHDSKKVSLVVPTNAIAPPSAFYCAKCYDSRLHQFRIGYWTPVPISHHLASLALSWYLTAEHAFLGNFDAELFLADLVAETSRFCSPILVNSLLYYACKWCTPADPTATGLSGAFLTETLSLLRATRDVEPLTTLIPALQILSISLFSDGNIQDALVYHEEAVSAGAKLSHLEAQGESHRRDPQEVQALRYTIWGAFASSIFWATFQRGTTPLGIPRCPVAALDDGNDSRRVYSKAHTTRRAFLARCQLCVILHQIGSHNLWYTQVDRPLDLAVDWGHYTQLLLWANNLPQDFNMSHMVADPVILLHLHFHMFVMDLFRPHLLVKSTKSMLDGEGRLAESIFEASAKQLLYLTLIISQHHPKVRTGTFWIPGVVYAINVGVALFDKQGSDAVFRHCLTTLIDLAKCFYHPQTIVYGALSLAVRVGVLDMPEARQIEKNLRKRDQSLKQTEYPLVSGLSMDMRWASETPLVSSGLVESLAEDFKELLVFDEFTNGGTFQDSVAEQVDTRAGSDM